MGNHDFSTAEGNPSLIPIDWQNGVHLVSLFLPSSSSILKKFSHYLYKTPQVTTRCYKTPQYTINNGCAFVEGMTGMMCVIGD